MTSKIVRLIDGKGNTGNRFPHNKYQQLILETEIIRDNNIQKVS